MALDRNGRVLAILIQGPYMEISATVSAFKDREREQERLEIEV